LVILVERRISKFI